MFTTPCFIRKNNERLRSTLEELGYIVPQEIKGSITEDNDSDYFIRTDIDTYSVDVVHPTCLTDDGGWEDYVDCGTNEELFLAIAALRDDSDIDQWFVSNCKGYKEECFFCEENKIENTILCYDLTFTDYHKATVEELIEHFK